MKNCFSTLGCPEWTWSEIVATAKDFGYEGIEVRGIANELYVPHTKPFKDDQMEETRERLSQLGLTIPCITSNCLLHESQKEPKHIQEAKEYVDVAAKMHIPYIRVLGDTHPQPGENIDVGVVVSALKEVCLYASGKGVTLLLETNGVFAKSETIKEVITQVNSDNLGILWDIHHPYRFMSESIAHTYEVLKPYIKHIHIKDSIIERGNIKYKMMGEGDIPITECLSLLKKDGYTGFISLEWVKRWYADLEEPGIVFMQFVNYIKRVWEEV